MRYTIGRAWIRDGRRDEFIPAMAGYAAASRAEAGCVFFDIGPLHGDPDGVIVIECWETAEAHAAHTAAEHFRSFGPVFGEMVSKAVFDEMDVAQVNTVRIGDGHAG